MNNDTKKILIKLLEEEKISLEFFEDNINSINLVIESINFNYSISMEENNSDIICSYYSQKINKRIIFEEKVRKYFTDLNDLAIYLIQLNIDILQFEFDLQ